METFEKVYVYQDDAITLEKEIQEKKTNKHDVSSDRNSKLCLERSHKCKEESFQ